MYLYRIEVQLDTEEAIVVVCAKDQKKAFELAEIEIESNYMKLPNIKEMSLVEKKPVRSGTAFIVKS